MMLGIGVDAVELVRFKSSLRRGGRSFLERVFTPAEQAYCRAQPKPWASYAVRFAAKEAVLKALGLGIGHDKLTSINIAVARSIPPRVELSGSVARHAKKKGVKKVWISLTHTEDVAMAFAVAEGK